MPGPGAPRRTGFTLIEMLAAVAVTSILAVFLIAGAQKIKSSAAQTVCVSNLRQWGVALHLFIHDNDSRIPYRGQGIQPVELVNRPEDWFNCLPPYFSEPSYGEQVANGHPARAGEKSVFVCPAAVNPGTYPHFICYGMNMYLSYHSRGFPHRLTELPNPSQLAFMADAPGGWASTIPSSQGYSVQARHNRRANVVFVDGHVQAFEGTYLGCGVGEPTRPDIRWKTLSPDPNLRPML